MEDKSLSDKLDEDKSWEKTTKSSMKTRFSLGISYLNIVGIILVVNWVEVGYWEPDETS